MTMLDDDQLAGLFARAGADFDVPESGPADILTRARASARSGPDETPEGQSASDGWGADEFGAGPGAGAPSRGRVGRLRRAGAAAARHRILTVAACVGVLLAAAGIGGALSATTSSPKDTSNLQASGSSHRPGTRSFSVLPTTTVPPPYATNHAASPSNGTVQAPKAAAGQPNVPVPTSVPGQKSPSLPSGEVGQSAKIEQTGTLGLNVKPGALTRTMSQLSAIASGAGGFVASSQTQTGAGSGGPPAGTITMQVPVADFSSVLKQAQALGKTSSLTTKATDVTGQYVDLQAQINALDATRQQYLTIMTQATSIGDILSVQEQLDSVQTQIQQLQGQLQLLTSQTSYSTLTVTVNEPTSPPRPGPAPESGVVKSWHDSISGFGDGVDGVIRYAGPVLFALLFLGLLLVGGRALWRRFRRHTL